MSAQAIQCPQCGSPLPVEEGARATVCGFCGSALRVTTGMSGHPMGVLEDIRAGTMLLAKERALQHLLESVERLDAQARSLQEQRDVALAGVEAQYPSPGCAMDAMLTVVGLFLLLLAMAVASDVVQWTLVCGGVWLIGLVLYRGSMAGKRRSQAIAKRKAGIESHSSSQLQALSDERARVCARIETLRREIHALAMEA